MLIQVTEILSARGADPEDQPGPSLPHVFVDVVSGLTLGNNHEVVHLPPDLVLLVGLLFLNPHRIPV